MLAAHMKVGDKALCFGQSSWHVPAQVTRGMNGFLLPCAGEANPSVVPAPYELGADITANNVVAAAFRNPPHQQHVARCCPGCIYRGIEGSLGLYLRQARAKQMATCVAGSAGLAHSCAEAWWRHFH